MRGASILAVLAIGACGHSAAAPRSHEPPPPVTPTAEGAPAFPERPPFLAPGERMIYRLSMHDLDVATYTVMVGERTQLDGRDVVVVQAGVESSPLVSLVKKVADNFTSWIDVETSRPVLFRSSELAKPGEEATETTDAEASRLEAGSFPVRVSKPGEADRVEQQVIGDRTLFDFNGFLIELRSWAPPAGTVATADVIRSRYLWRTTITMVGYEEVVTDLGKLPAVRIDGVSQRLGRDGVVDPKSDTRRYQIWISDDADRVPLQLVARTDYGDLRMDITDYQPGGERIGQ